jgi:hypothetical protein
MPDGPNRAPGRAVTPCQTLALEFTLPLSSQMTIGTLLCGVNKIQINASTALSEIAATVLDQYDITPTPIYCGLLRLLRCSMVCYERTAMFLFETIRSKLCINSAYIFMVAYLGGHKSCTQITPYKAHCNSQNTFALSTSELIRPILAHTFLTRNYLTGKLLPRDWGLREKVNPQCQKALPKSQCHTSPRPPPSQLDNAHRAGSRRLLDPRMQSLY